MNIFAEKCGEESVHLILDFLNNTVKILEECVCLILEEKPLSIMNHRGNGVNE
ncbi:MAG: hypothetical protein ACUVTF_06615 [bacterium]